jgi:hypothetical protein
VTDEQVNVADLPPAEYLWRVATVGADGTASRFSEPADFELEPAGTTTLAAKTTAVAADTPGVQLKVPVLSQHKDTAMLLLERNQETGTHAWDKNHGDTDSRDPADNMNCAIAMVAMISAFYGGNLSQDRIGYEILARRGNPAGPEGDLMYGQGISGLEASEAFRFALGGVSEGGLMSFDDMWNTIKTELDAGRPVAGANSHHGFVVTGYKVENGRRLVYLNDPWHGRTYSPEHRPEQTAAVRLQPLAHAGQSAGAPAGGIDHPGLRWRRRGRLRRDRALQDTIERLRHRRRPAARQAGHRHRRLRPQVWLCRHEGQPIRARLRQ